METGEIGRKLKRGKHTTRHSQIIPVGEDTYLMDTPGFSSLYVEDIRKEELKDYIPEFYPYEGSCRFLPCTHTHEPDCEVKAAVERGEIAPSRYASYCTIRQELADPKKRGKKS